MEFLSFTSDQWLDLGLSLLLIVVITMGGRWLLAFVLERGIHKLVGHTRTTLDDALLNAVKPLLLWPILIFALRVGIVRLDFLRPLWEASLASFFFILSLVIGFIFAWRIVAGIFVWYEEEVAAQTESKQDDQLVPFLRRMALGILTVMVLIIFLDHYDIDVSGLVTTLGIGSLAIALAAQAALSDIFSGFIIMLDQPFRIGDRVEVRDLNTWGDVVDIGLRSTRIRTRDNRTVIVPNAVIGRSLLVNYTYPDRQYRIQVHIEVAYGSDLEQVRQTMIEAVRDVEGVLPDQKIEALFLEFSPSGLVFRLRWWIESYVDTRRMYDRVNTVVYNALNEAGITISRPQRDIHHKIAPSEVDWIAGLLRPD